MRMRIVGVVAVALTVFALVGPFDVRAQSGPGEHWVGTWATAVVPRPRTSSGGAGPSPLNFSGQTLRQIAHVSLGGSRVRVVLSNAFGILPLPVGAAGIALRQKESSIVSGSKRMLTFGGSASTTVAAGAIAVSDPVDFALPPFADVAVDIYLPGDTAASPSPVTMHTDAFQTNYVSMAGNHVGETDLPVSTTTQSWFFLSSVEVTAPATVGAVVAFGDSLTDGTRSTPDTNNRWPDHLV